MKLSEPLHCPLLVFLIDFLALTLNCITFTSQRQWFKNSDSQHFWKGWDRYEATGEVEYEWKIRDIYFIFYFYFFLFIEFIGVTLINKIIQVSGTQFLNTTSVHCIIPFLEIYPKNHKTLIQQNICTCMFIAVLFTIAKLWKQPKYPPVDEWIKKSTGTFTQ